MDLKEVIDFLRQLRFMIKNGAKLEVLDESIMLKEHELILESACKGGSESDKKN